MNDSMCVQQSSEKRMRDRVSVFKRQGEKERGIMGMSAADSGKAADTSELQREIRHRVHERS